MTPIVPLPTFPLHQLPGLKSTDCNQLRKLGIESTQDLLAQTRSPQAFRQLAQQLQIEDRWLRKWMALAEFSQLPSVGLQYCGVLLHAGVTSIAQLATLSPHRLHQQVLRLQVQSTRQRQLCPHPGIIQQWIHDARQLRRR